MSSLDARQRDTQALQSEAPSENEANKHLDKAERFGFMKRGKASRCKTGCRITPDDSRVYDKKSKEGPICVPCAYKRMREGLPSDDLKVVMAGLESLSAKIDGVIEMLSPAKPVVLDPQNQFTPPPARRESGYCDGCYPQGGAASHMPATCPARPGMLP